MGFYISAHAVCKHRGPMEVNLPLVLPPQSERFLGAGKAIPGVLHWSALEVWVVGRDKTKKA